MRRWTTALALALTAAGLAACSDGAGGGSKTLVVYSGRSESLVGPLLADFEKASGIDLEVRYAGSAELAAQILEEGDNSPADVFLSQDAGALGALAKEGRLGGLAQAQLDKVSSRYRAEDGTWVGVTGRVRVVAYNPAKVAAKDLPASVFELAQPVWKDRIGIAPTNASFQSFVTGMRVLAGEERTTSWLRSLVANKPKEYESNDLVLDAVQKGDVAVGLINHYYWYEKAAEIGRDKMTARVHFLPAADPGALVNVSGVGVLKDSGRTASAAALVDFLLGTKAQQYFTDQVFEYALVTGVAPTPGLPPLTQVPGPPIDLSDLSSLSRTLELLAETGLT